MMRAKKSGSRISIAKKLQRAREHLDELIEIDSKFQLLEITLPFVRDEVKGIGYNVVKLPDPPEDVPLVAGDCLHNLRSALDYLIWQAVLSAGEQAPGRHNMFPICVSEHGFQEQLKRGRLQGLPASAIAAVKSLQPFGLKTHPLAVLDELCNSDKHRDLHIAVTVASDMETLHLKNGQVVMQTFLGGADVENGAIFGDIGIPLELIPSDFEVKIVGRAAAFIGFKLGSDSESDPLPVVHTLEEIHEHITSTVLPEFTAYVHP